MSITEFWFLLFLLFRHPNFCGGVDWSRWPLATSNISSALESTNKHILLGVLNRLSWLLIATWRGLMVGTIYLAGHCSDIYVNPFHIHNNPMRPILTLSPFYSGRNWSLERLAQVHTAGKWQIWASNPSSLTPESVILAFRRTAFQEVGIFIYSLWIRKFCPRSHI